MNIEARAREVVAHAFELPPAQIALESRFTDIGDSLDRIEMLIATEETFNVLINDDEDDRLNTFGDLVTLLNAKVKQ